MGVQASVQAWPFMYTYVKASTCMLSIGAGAFQEAAQIDGVREYEAVLEVMRCSSHFTVINNII